MAHITSNAQWGAPEAVLRQRLRFAMLGTILAAAALIRIAGLSHLPLWMDEFSSIWFSDQSYAYLWTEVPRFENHPPLYYMILKAWRGLAGTSEAAIRAPSVLFGLGLVAMMFVSGRVVGRVSGRTAGAGPDTLFGDGWGLGLMAAALAALSQFQYAFSTEARAYAMAGFAVSLMMAGALGIVCGAPGRPDGTRMPWAGLALVAGMALCIWSHTLGMLSAGLAGLFLIGWWALAGAARGPFLRLAAMAAAVLLICLPQIQNLMMQAGRDYSEFWIPLPDLNRLLRVSVLVAGLPGLPGGLTVQMLVTAGLMGLGLAGLWRIARPAGLAAPVLALALLLSAGFWLVVVAYTYLSTPVFLPRTLIFMQPAVFLIMAAAPWALAGRARAVAAPGLVALAAIALAGERQVQVYSRDARAAVETVAAQAPDAPVLSINGSIVYMFDYYEKRLGVELDTRSLTGPFPPRDANGRPDFITSPVVTEAAMKSAVAAAGDAPVVWLVLQMGHFDELGPPMRARLRETGRRETAIIGGAPSDHMSLFRFDLGETGGTHVTSTSVGEKP